MIASLDSLLWSISRAYRRRKIRRSHVYTELLAPIRPDDTALDRVLERPAILSRGMPIIVNGQTINWTRGLLVEKLTDEAMMHGSWPSVYAQACLACSAGDHGMYGQGACLCPCHRAGGGIGV